MYLLLRRRMRCRILCTPPPHTSCTPIIAPPTATINNNILCWPLLFLLLSPYTYFHAFSYIGTTTLQRNKFVSLIFHRLYHNILYYYICTGYHFIPTIRICTVMRIILFLYTQCTVNEGRANKITTQVLNYT